MKRSKTIIADSIMPGAAPAQDEIRRWQALPRSEQVKRLQKAIRQGFDSGISTRSIDEIIKEAHARATSVKNG